MLFVMFTCNFNLFPGVRLGLSMPECFCKMVKVVNNCLGDL